MKYWRELHDEAMYAERAGDNVEALRCWHEALKSIRSGTGRPADALVVLDQMARHHQRHGDHADAEKVVRHILDLAERLDGADTVPAAKARSWLAELVAAQGRVEEAEKELLQSVMICRERLGERHSELGLTLSALLAVQQDLNKHEAAEKTCAELYGVYERIYGPQHIKAARCLNELALLCVRQAKYEEADQHFRALFERWKNPAPEALGDVVKGLNDLALLYVARGQQRQAGRAAKRALHIAEAKLVSETPEYGRTLNILGVLAASSGQNTEAEDYFTRALQVTRRVLGNDHPRVREIEENFARVQASHLTPPPDV